MKMKKLIYKKVENASDNFKKFMDKALKDLKIFNITCE
jgi:hypothetical protein